MVVKDCKKSLTVSGAGEHDNTNVLLAVYTGKIATFYLYLICIDEDMPQGRKYTCSQ